MEWTSMKVLLIIPAYNEEKNILKVCKKIDESNMDDDYIVINDGSQDKTGEICKMNDIPCIDLLDNLGIGGAVQTGYIYAEQHGYDIAIQFDGDGQHDVRYIPHLIKQIKFDKADLCIGSRFIDSTSEFHSTKARRAGIKIISNLIRLITGKRISDPTSGFRAANKNVINEFVKFYPTDYPEPESIVTLIKKKYRIREIPVNMLERKEGKSSISARKSIYYMIKVGIAIIIRGIAVGKRGNK
jgi:glycosyltransferase involved in cell wall biosynthesis